MRQTKFSIPVLLGVLVLGISVFLFSQGRVQSGEAQSDDFQQLLQDIRDDFPQVNFITTDELADWLERSDKKKPILLDARAEAEFQVSHLPNAINVDGNKQLNQVLEGINKDEPMVVYCSVGYRSAVLAKKLSAKGYRQVYNLEGSIFAWANEGRKVYRGNEEVFEVHPYDSYWGRFLEKRE